MKTWQKPLLIVLVRSKPEEAILVICKAEGLDLDQATTASGCGFDDGQCTDCMAVDLS
jgi:hypothetical protein